jgi:hypothetical protein
MYELPPKLIETLFEMWVINNDGERIEGRV